MKVWAKTDGEVRDGKFLVVRRDGSIPCWPHFVLGARDPAAPVALEAYAFACERMGLDPEYVKSLRELAKDFEAYRTFEGNGDADAGPHRKDDPAVVEVMRGSDGSPTLWHETHNVRK
jgi:hypothetical protein